MIMSNQGVMRSGIAVAVGDISALTDFYVGQLGFELEATFDDPPYAILVRSGMRLSLAEHATMPRGGARCFLAAPEGNLIELEQLASECIEKENPE